MKGIDYYLRLNYSISLRRLEEDEGGGWLAEIPGLPGCMSDGETTEEALINIQDAKLCWLESALAQGVQVPLPRKQIDEQYSGKFTLRIPKTMHRMLAMAAKEEGVSLNQYIQNLLSFGFGQVTANIVPDNKQIIVSINHYDGTYDSNVGPSRELWRNKDKPKSLI